MKHEDKTPREAYLNDPHPEFPEWKVTQLIGGNPWKYTKENCCYEIIVRQEWLYGKRVYIFQILDRDNGFFLTDNRGRKRRLKSFKSAVKAIAKEIEFD